MTRIEVVNGLRSPECRTAEGLFALIQLVPVDERIARRADELGPSYRASDSADLAIAATAEALEADLATTNVKHFPMFPDVQSPY